MTRPAAPRVPTLPAACRRLIGMYDVNGWWPARSRFEIMVGAVLVQNTRWANVAAAIAALRRERCLNPAKISTLKSADLRALIRPAGCQSVKARRLQALSAWVEFGRPRFVADKYARTWFGRMGVARPEELASYEKCREFAELALARSKLDFADLHAAIVLHGQVLCRVRPQCDACGLRRTCELGCGTTARRSFDR